MYQSIIRDPSGNGLIRIQPDVCGEENAVVNGSLLLVPPGTTAFVAINGILSPPYRPGRYEIFTGVDPCFVRLQHIMTRGDSGTSVSVFFVSTEKARFLRLGTGEFPFREHRFLLTVKALASCSLTFSIADPLKVIQKLVGSYCGAFSEEDIDPCLEQIILTPVREALSREISRLEITEFNSGLSRIGKVAAAAIRVELQNYGICLERFDVTAIHIPDDELSRLYALEEQYADGKTRTDLEYDHLQRVWNGNVHDRMLCEMMTGISSRGQAASGESVSSPYGNDNGLTSMMRQMMILSQMLPLWREPLSQMTRVTDMFRSAWADEPENTFSAEDVSSSSVRYRRCPSCSENVMRGNGSCPVCGYRFVKREE